MLSQGFPRLSSQVCWRYIIGRFHKAGHPTWLMARQHLTVAVGWEAYWSCPAECQPVVPPARPSLTLQLASPRARVPERLVKVTVAFSDLAFETLEVMKCHFHVSYWSKESQAHSDARRHRPHLSMGKVSKSFGAMFDNCHNSFLNLRTVYNSLRTV